MNQSLETIQKKEQAHKPLDRKITIVAYRFTRFRCHPNQL